MPINLAKAEWHYTGTNSRDLRLDWLRGYAVFIMVVDHIGDSSWLYFLTGGDQFYVSAAEAFIFLSGFIVGVVYGNLLRQENFKAVVQKAWGRAWTLYKLTMALSLLILIGGRYNGSPWINEIPKNLSWRFLVDITLLHHALSFADIPLVYAILMFIAPFGLYLLKKKKAWLLMLVSSLLWLIYQIPLTKNWIPLIPNAISLNVQPLQFLFFIAMIGGYYNREISNFISLIAKPIQTSYVIFITTVVIFLLSIFLIQNLPQSIQTVSSPVTKQQTLVDTLFSKKLMGIGRLVAAFFVFQVAYVFTTLYWKPLQQIASWLLPLGQNSLYAYTVHVGFIAVFSALTPYFPQNTIIIHTLNTFFQLSILTLIFLMIKRKTLFAYIPR